MHHTLIRVVLFYRRGKDGKKETERKRARGEEREKTGERARDRGDRVSTVQESETLPG